MKTIPTLIIWFSSCFLANESSAVTGPLEKSVFELGQVEIGSTSFDQIKSWLGEAKKSSTKTDELSQHLCYSFDSAGETRQVIFETGPMGGFNIVTGIRISSRAASEECTVLTSGFKLDSFRNGVRIGQSQSSFLQQFPMKFRQKNSVLTYEQNFEREATTDELSVLRKNWPLETKTSFDVNVYIRAQFSKGRLTDYYVKRIESYN